MLFFLTLIALTVAAAVNSVKVRANALESSSWQSQAAYAGEGALEYAYSRVWEPYLAFNGGSPGSLESFQKFLEKNSKLILGNGGVIDLTADAPDFDIPLSSLTVRRISH